MKRGFFSMGATRFPKERRGAWKKLIPKSAMNPPKRIYRKLAVEPDAEAKAKAWRPSSDIPRKYPVTESHTGRAIVFNSREEAIAFIQRGIDAVFAEEWEKAREPDTGE